MERNLAGKIAPEIMERIKELQKKLAGLLKKPVSSGIMTIKCHGYYREIARNYSLDDFDFAPGDIIVDKHDVMSICLGVSKSPNSVEGQVLWFLSEEDEELYYLAENIPHQIQRNYALVLAA
ncbi:MAG TPA: hypothetical protein VFD16_03540 [Candidatus Saccharimonadales bacterium]|nr:hypothetical protein [Candidatus Saccharimonadales bacterium]